jgi:hypothetical protein
MIIVGVNFFWVFAVLDGTNPVVSESEVASHSCCFRLVSSKVSVAVVEVCQLQRINSLIYYICCYNNSQN